MGDMSVFLRAVANLVRGQVMSIGFAFVGIFIVLLFVFRSVKIASLAMVPNILPSFILGGVMGIAGITLNLQTIVAIPVIMGLAVDDTIHYILFMEDEFARAGSYQAATKETFHKVGGGIVNTSVILFLGFMSFFFTPVNSLHDISLLLVVGVATALAADLFLSPALIAKFKAFGPETNKNKN